MLALQLQNEDIFALETFTYSDSVSTYHTTYVRLDERVGTSIYSNTPDIDSLLAIENTAAVDFSYNVEITKDSNDWINLASQHLDENCVCVLVYDQLEPYITARDCQSTEDEAISHLDDLKKRIRKQGVDPDGKDGPFRQILIGVKKRQPRILILFKLHH